MRSIGHGNPSIKPRFFLRRWADRAVLGWIRRAGDLRGIGLECKPLMAWMRAVHLLPLVLFGATCLVGVIHPFDGLAMGFLAAAAAWPGRWAVGPWVGDPGEMTVRALVPNQYQLIHDLCPDRMAEQIVAWAVEDPWFDTRHLVACMPEDMQFRREEPFVGRNAMDLFGGLVGRRVEAIRQGREMEKATAGADDGGGARRRL